MTKIKKIYFKSNQLNQEIEIQLIIPDRIDNVLYFLHGALESSTTVIEKSNIFDLSNQYNIAVVLPSLGNSFYIDVSSEFLMNELYPYLQKDYFSHLDRNNYYIGGYSMGGYGAFYNGLKYPHYFSKVISISGALDLPFCVRFVSHCTNELPDYIQKTKQELEKYSLVNLLCDNLEQQYYLACGNQDILTFINQRFINELDKKNIDYLYKENDGNHDWKYWKKELKEMFKWLSENKV